MASFKVKNIRPRTVVVDGIRIRDLISEDFRKFFEDIFERKNYRVRFISLAIIIEQLRTKKGSEAPEVAKVSLLHLRHERPSEEEGGTLIIESDDEEILNTMLEKLSSE